MLLLSVCIILSLSFNIYQQYEFYDYKIQQTDSLMTEVSRRLSDVKDLIEDGINNKNLSTDTMFGIYAEFRAVASLFSSNSNIYYYAESDFQYIGTTFLSGVGSTKPCYTKALFDDEIISQNEIEYMQYIIEIVNMTLQNVYEEKTDTFNMNILNENLESVNLLLHDYDKSPYLLIKTEPNSNY